MMEKKYELVKEFKFNGKQLFRLRAIRSFGDVNVGDKGGLVSSENIVPHYDESWVDEDSIVEGNIRLKNTHVVSSNIVGYASKVIISDCVITMSDITYTDSEISISSSSLNQTDISSFESDILISKSDIQKTEIFTQFSDIEIEKSKVELSNLLLSKAEVRMLRHEAIHMVGGNNKEYEIKSRKEVYKDGKCIIPFQV